MRICISRDSIPASMTNDPPKTKPKAKVPKALLDARPALAGDLEASHPATSPNVAGAPPKRYTTGVHAQIIKNIEEGNRPHVAALMAGIPTASFYSWMREGREGNVHLVKFVEDVEIAMGVAEGNALKLIKTETSDAELNIDNAKWWLERSRADGYSKEANAKANAMIAEFLGRLETGLTPAEFQKVISVATGQSLAVDRATFQLHAHEEDDH